MNLAAALDALDLDPSDPAHVDDIAVVRRVLDRRRSTRGHDRDRLDRFVTGPQITRVADSPLPTGRGAE